MDNKLFSTDPWKLSLPTENCPKGYYICISGNSGSGKSTTISAIAKNIESKVINTIAIDEKLIHHPYLPLLFHRPKSYALFLQINFMLQRAMVIKHWFENGYNVVMERSHLEDPVFIRHLKNLGYISQKELNEYMLLWGSINNRLPNPDLILFLDVQPNTSINRINNDEQKGLREKEFPSETVKDQWINSWYTLYQERLAELKADENVGSKLIIISENESIDDILALVKTRLMIK